MDKIYPRLQILKVTCDCGVCRLDKYPWKVYLVEYLNQMNPPITGTASSFEDARKYAADKVNATK